MNRWWHIDNENRYIYIWENCVRAWSLRGWDGYICEVVYQLGKGYRRRVLNVRAQLFNQFNTLIYIVWARIGWNFDHMYSVVGSCTAESMNVTLLYQTTNCCVRMETWHMFFAKEFLCASVMYLISRFTCFSSKAQMKKINFFGRFSFEAKTEENIVYNYAANIEKLRFTKKQKCWLDIFPSHTSTDFGYTTVIFAIRMYLLSSVNCEEPFVFWQTSE